jgi:hypothetical protein
MKTIFSAVIILFSLNVFAEDVYDRINECEKNGGEQGCIYKLLRELADKNSAKESDGQMCVVGPVLGQFHFILPSSFANAQLGSEMDASSMDDAIELYRNQWKKLGCSEKAKVNCSIVSDYLSSYIVIHGLRPIKLRPNNPQKALIELQRFVCL